MHIAATNPLGIQPEDIPDEIIQKEKKSTVPRPWSSENRKYRR